MKSLMFLIVALAVINLTACGQIQKNVPDKVKTAFSEKFPDAGKVKWSQENENEWEAEFKWNGTEYSANFSNMGEWKETEHEISEKDLPVKVKATLSNEFPDFKIDETEISETADGKVYELQLKKEGRKEEVAIDQEGKVIKKKQVNKEDEEEDDED